MRDALIAYSRGECDTPMPMHLEIAPESAEVHMKSSYRRDIAQFADVSIAAIPAEVAHETRLIVTCTPAREPLLHAAAIHPGTHISCVGSDSLGKHEIDAAILSRAALVLVDSLEQCEKL